MLVQELGTSSLRGDGTGQGCTIGALLPDWVFGARVLLALWLGLRPKRRGRRAAV